MGQQAREFNKSRLAGSCDIIEAKKNLFFDSLAHSNDIEFNGQLLKKCNVRMGGGIQDNAIVVEVWESSGKAPVSFHFTNLELSASELDVENNTWDIRGKKVRFF